LVHRKEENIDGSAIVFEKLEDEGDLVWITTLTFDSYSFIFLKLFGQASSRETYTRCTVMECTSAAQKAMLTTEAVHGWHTVASVIKTFGKTFGERSGKPTILVAEYSTFMSIMSSLFSGLGEATTSVNLE